MPEVREWKQRSKARASSQSDLEFADNQSMADTPWKDADVNVSFPLGSKTRLSSYLIVGQFRLRLEATRSGSSGRSPSQDRRFIDRRRGEE